MLASERDTPALTGFYCEIQAPNGAWHAHSVDAGPSQSQRATEHFRLPGPKSSEILVFPRDFEGPGETRPTLASVIHGRYYVLWWAWKRLPDGLSVGFDFVTCCWFAIGHAVGEFAKVGPGFRSGGCPPQGSSTGTAQGAEPGGA
jgi:hypothetical protein